MNCRVPGLMRSPEKARMAKKIQHENSFSYSWVENRDTPVAFTEQER